MYHSLYNKYQEVTINIYFFINFTISETHSSTSSSENIDIMNEMPPSLSEISINGSSQPEDLPSLSKQKNQDDQFGEPPESMKATDGDRTEMTFNISVKEIRDLSKGDLSIQDMEFTEIREMDESVKSEKSRLLSVESEHSTVTGTSTNDQSKGSEDATKESLLLSVATMNKSLGLLPTNLSCLEPKVTKGLSSISFVEKDQLVSGSLNSFCN